MKMYLTVGDLGEGFAACLRRGRPSQLGLTGKPTTATQGKKGCLAIPLISCRPILLLRGMYYRGGGSCGKVVGAGSHGHLFCLWAEYRGLSRCCQTKGFTASIFGSHLQWQWPLSYPSYLKIKLIILAFHLHWAGLIKPKYGISRSWEGGMCTP